MSRLSAETGQPVTFAMLQVPGAPDLWKEQMQASLEARENGAQLYPQVAGRPFGVLVGWQTCHPFMRKPSYQAIAELPIDGIRDGGGSLEEVFDALYGGDRT